MISLWAGSLFARGLIRDTENIFRGPVWLRVADPATPALDGAQILGLVNQVRGTFRVSEHGEQGGNDALIGLRATRQGTA